MWIIWHENFSFCGKDFCGEWKKKWFNLSNTIYSKSNNNYIWHSHSPTLSRFQCLSLSHLKCKQMFTAYEHVCVKRGSKQPQQIKWLNEPKTRKKVNNFHTQKRPNTEYVISFLYYVNTIHYVATTCSQWCLLSNTDSQLSKGCGVLFYLAHNPIQKYQCYIIQRLVELVYVIIFSPA